MAFLTKPFYVSVTACINFTIKLINEKLQHGCGNLCDIILDVCLQTKGDVIVICEIPPFPAILWESPSQEGHAPISSRGFYSLVIQGGLPGSPAGLPHPLGIYLEIC